MTVAWLIPIFLTVMSLFGAAMWALVHVVFKAGGEFKEVKIGLSAVVPRLDRVEAAQVNDRAASIESQKAVTAQVQSLATTVAVLVDRAARAA